MPISTSMQSPILKLTYTGASTEQMDRCWAADGDWTQRHTHALTCSPSISWKIWPIVHIARFFSDAFLPAAVHSGIQVPNVDTLDMLNSRVEVARDMLLCARSPVDFRYDEMPLLMLSASWCEWLCDDRVLLGTIWRGERTGTSLTPQLLAGFDKLDKAALVRPTIPNRLVEAAEELLKWILSDWLLDIMTSATAVQVFWSDRTLGVGIDTIDWSEHKSEREDDFFQCVNRMKRGCLFHLGYGTI